MAENTLPDVGTQIGETDLQNGRGPDVEVASALAPAQAEGPSEGDITQFIDIAQRLEKELCSIVIGQERVVRELLLALLAVWIVLLGGLAGLVKILLVR